jgi:prophage DNA circulation protein
MRDWLSTLWPASYMGVPFWTEKADERGGRRLFVHEFPRRDDPYVEDLGACARRFDLTAYVASDMADFDSAALAAVFDSEGPGPLVLPVQGSISAHCQTWSRAHERDRLGFIAFQAAFVRDGAATSVVTQDYLAQLVFDAADGLAAVATLVAPSAVTIVNQPDWVAASIADALRTGAATIESMRAAAILAPADSSAIALSTAAFFDAIAPAVSSVTGLDGSIVATQFALAQTLSLAMDPFAAIAAFSAELDVSAPPSAAGVAASAAIDHANRLAIAAIVDLPLITGLAQAIVSAAYVARDDAQRARAAFIAYCDAALASAAGGVNADLYVALETLRSATINALSAVILDLRPLVTIEASTSMPSLWWAWRLYEDPLRAPELVGRNAIRHPSYFPRVISALAS